MNGIKKQQRSLCQKPCFDSCYKPLQRKKIDEKNLKIDEFKRKLMIPESEIPQNVENMIKSKIGKIFVNEKILAEYCVKSYEINPYFYEHYEKKS